MKKYIRDILVLYYTIALCITIYSMDNTKTSSTPPPFSMLEITPYTPSHLTEAGPSSRKRQDSHKRNVCVLLNNNRKIYPNPSILHLFKILRSPSQQEIEIKLPMANSKQAHVLFNLVKSALQQTDQSLENIYTRIIQELLTYNIDQVLILLRTAHALGIIEDNKITLALSAALITRYTHLNPNISYRIGANIQPYLNPNAEFLPEKHTDNEKDIYFIQKVARHYKNSTGTSLPLRVGTINQQLIEGKQFTITDNTLSLHTQEYEDIRGIHNITNINTVTKIDLSYNRLIHLPVELGELVTVQDLDLSYNYITRLICPVFALKNLIRLNLHMNQLTELSHEIKELSNLTELNLSMNKLERLPLELIFLTRLQKLFISDNPFNPDEATIITRITESLNRQGCTTFNLEAKQLTPHTPS